MSTRDIFSMFNENDPWLPLAQVVRQTNSPLVRRGGCCTQVRETDLDFLALVAFFFGVWVVHRRRALCPVCSLQGLHGTFNLFHVPRKQPSPGRKGDDLHLGCASSAAPCPHTGRGRRCYVRLLRRGSDMHRRSRIPRGKCICMGPSTSDVRPSTAGGCIRRLKYFSGVDMYGCICTF